ncbi:SGS-domain-containing protein [Morchella conica CCBAS932]|uniref:SGS-domain-containing protein n=1 Tax=Morchella conica CCBAS932 TaxID=1392247 RepID=A0A3N4KJC1_9PEZI|nr:SGS-domain-containing protein [Morchella conica CCBAS932]
MPSPATLSDQGSKALNSQNYAQAIDLYTQALRQTPESPDYYLKRSTAYQRSSNYASALRDAELAVVLANKRGKRELIGAAQLRRGISLLMEGKLGDAGFCFSEAEKKASNDKDKNLIGIWKGKLEMQLAKVDEDDITREVTVKEIPDVEIPKVTGEKKDGQTGLSEKTVAQAVTPPISRPKGVVTPPSKIRHEWYQTSTHIVITIYVKGVPKDEATVEIQNTSLSIAFPLASGPEFTFDLDPLLYPIKADKSSYAILPTKIEIKLEKQIPGQKWGDLEASEATQLIGTIPLPTTSATPTSMAKVDLPLYPTSSKSGPKDWDKVAKDLTRSKKNKDIIEGGAIDTDEGTEYDSEAESGDPVNHFFKKLYKDADEDTRRAMMKSYVESNGTALSTNWKEVGKAPVETSPPEGMVAHKWNS